MVGNLIAMGIGPTLIAVISDYVLEERGNIALALAIVSSIVLPLAALLMLMGLRYYRNSVEQAQSWDGTVATAPA